MTEAYEHELKTGRKNVMYIKISQKLKVQSLATDAEEGRQVLTKAKEEEKTVCTVLPVKATVPTWASVRG